MLTRLPTKKEVDPHKRDELKQYCYASLTITFERQMFKATNQKGNGLFGKKKTKQKGMTYFNI